MKVEKTFSLHSDDWPEVEYLIGRKANERIYKDAQDVLRLQEQAAKELLKAQQREARMTRDNQEKELAYRRRIDRKNGINTIDQHIDGQVNPLYRPL